MAVIYDNEVHNGLENQPMRDSIARMIAEAWELEKSNLNYKEKNRVPYDTENPETWVIENAKQDIIIAKETIRIANTRLGIKGLMNMHGWTDWDISDWVSQTTDGWLHFIGTEEEYNTIMEKLKAQFIKQK